MQGLTHGSDLRLAPTIRPIADEIGGAPRPAIKKIAAAGFNALQLDATMPGLRPRELDTTARRDLKTTIARSGLTLAGIDFFIPPDHYSDPAHLDRAAQATQAACQLASDLGRVPLTLNLPDDQADASLRQELFATADALGVPLIICHTQPTDKRLDWLKQHQSAGLTAAIDPAALLMARIDPVKTAQALTDWIGVARLSDATRGQSDSRAIVGRGDLDLLAYRVSVDLAGPKHGPVVLDLRSLTAPFAAASAAKTAWERAVM